MTAEPDRLDPGPNARHRARAIATFVLALWIIVSSFWHLGMAIKTAMGPKPRSIATRLSFPSVAMTKSSSVAGDSGVSPGTGVAGAVQPTGSGAVEDNSDVGIDIKCTWEDGVRKGCFLALGPIAFLDVPWWLACLIAAVFICTLIVLLLGALLDWVCNTEWIKDKDVRRRCKKKKCKKWCLCCNKWFCWLEVFVQWLARQVCAWKQVLLWLVWAACVIAGFILFCL